MKASLCDNDIDGDQCNNMMGYGIAQNNNGADHLCMYPEPYHVSCALRWHQSDLLLARIFMIWTEWPQLFNSKLTILNIES